MRNSIYIKKRKKHNFKFKCCGCGKRVNTLTTFDFDGRYVMLSKSYDNGFCGECIKKEIYHIPEYNYK